MNGVLGFTFRVSSFALLDAKTLATRNPKLASAKPAPVVLSFARFDRHSRKERDKTVMRFVPRFEQGCRDSLSEIEVTTDKKKWGGGQV